MQAGQVLPRRNWENPCLCGVGFCAGWTREGPFPSRCQSCHKHHCTLRRWEIPLAEKPVDAAGHGTGVSEYFLPSALPMVAIFFFWATAIEPYAAVQEASPPECGGNVVAIFLLECERTQKFADFFVLFCFVLFYLLV